MRHRRVYPFVIILFAGLLLLSSCRTKKSIGDKSADPGNDGGAIVSEMMGHFQIKTYSATVNISKVYKNGLRYDDVLHMFSKFDEQQDHIRVMLSIKPQADRKGAGVLAEMRNRELVSAYRFIPETKRVVTINPRQNFSNVVIGGLSLQDFQMVQGVSPFTEMRVTGREDVNGKSCDELEVIFRDQSQYHHGQIFTTVAERLPVLLRAFNKDGDLAKEIMFDKLEQVGKVWVVKQLSAVERTFDYTSTFSFENIQVNAPIEDSTFTVDFLQKGWQESPEIGLKAPANSGACGAGSVLFCKRYVA